MASCQEDHHVRNGWRLSSGGCDGTTRWHVGVGTGLFGCIQPYLASAKSPWTRMDAHAWSGRVPTVTTDMEIESCSRRRAGQHCMLAEQHEALWFCPCLA